jgi:hypothetical protein
LVLASGKTLLTLLPRTQLRNRGAVDFFQHFAVIAPLCSSRKRPSWPPYSQTPDSIIKRQQVC